jgi:hypothetical protein
LHGPELGHRSDDDGGYVQGNVRPSPAPVTRAKIAAPHTTPITPSSAVPTAATSKAVIPLKVARQAGLDHSELTMAAIRLEAVSSAEVMTSTYKDIPRISIGQSCAPGAEIPTKTQLRTPTTPAPRAGTVVAMIEIH